MPSKRTSPRTGTGQTRRAILDALKREGPTDSSELSRQLGVSAMAVRQHLYALADEGLVTYIEEPRPLGRPAKLWRITSVTDTLFPDAHPELTVGLIDAAKEVFGAKGLDRLIAARAKHQVDAYRSRIPAEGSVRKRVEALAAIRAEEGYMAEARALADGSFELIENHCPICVAATACRGLCGAELAVFRDALGADLVVERTEHIMAGARRCVY